MESSQRHLSESEDSAVPNELSSLSPTSCSSSSDQWKEHGENVEEQSQPVKNLIRQFNKGSTGRKTEETDGIHRSESFGKFDHQSEKYDRSKNFGHQPEKYDESGKFDQKIYDQPEKFDHRSESRSDLSSEISEKSEFYHDKLSLETEKLKFLTLTPPRTVSESSFCSYGQNPIYNHMSTTSLHSPRSVASSTHQPSNNQRLLSALDKEVNQLKRVKLVYEKPNEEQVRACY